MSKLGSAATLIRHFVRARWSTRLRGAELQAHQDLQARRIIVYAMQRSPFYRNHFAGLDLSQWRDFPTVDKRLMMAEFDGFNTRGVRRDEAMNLALTAEASGNYGPRLGNLTVGLSSGTSGHRGLFVVDPYESAAWAGTILARVLPNLRRSGFKVLLFLRSGSNLYESVGSHWLQFRFCDLMTPLADAVAIMNDFNPDILVGPPSMLAILAVERKASRLKTSPGKVISVAEVLDPQDAEKIAEVFGAPVHQIYQCTEGLLAVTCEQGSLHVQEDFVVLQYEPIAGDANRVSPIVTDLGRRTQPILRYRLNDILILDQALCGCGSGFQRIARIEGRQDDMLYFSNSGGHMRTFFPDTMRRIVLLASGDIADYEIVQELPGTLRLHFELNPGSVSSVVEEKLRACFEAILGQYGCKASSIDVVEGLPPRRADQKRRRVQRRG